VPEKSPCDPSEAKVEIRAHELPSVGLSKDLTYWISTNDAACYRALATGFPSFIKPSDSEVFDASKKRPRRSRKSPVHEHKLALQSIIDMIEVALSGIQSIPSPFTRVTGQDY
jgi:hypothetical protein